MLGGDDLIKEYTCKAGIFEAEIKGLPEAVSQEEGDD